MTDPNTIRIRRIINALVWLVIWAGIILFTESWGDWGSMFFEALIPVLLGLYVHIVLRGRDSPQ